MGPHRFEMKQGLRAPTPRRGRSSAKAASGGARFCSQRFLPVREVDSTQDHTSKMYIALSQQPEFTMTVCQTAQHNLPGTESSTHGSMDVSHTAGAEVLASRVSHTAGEEVLASRQRPSCHLTLALRLRRLPSRQAGDKHAGSIDQPSWERRRACTEACVTW